MANRKKICTSVSFSPIVFQKIEDEKSIIRETTGIELSTSAYLEMLVMMRGKKDKVRDVEWLSSVQIGSRRRKPTQVPKVERQARRFGKGREYEIESYEKTVQLKEAIAKQPTNRVPVAIKSTINFANVLNDAVHAGFMSEEEALRRFTEYKKATTDEERSRLWDSLHEYNELQGYEESN